MQDRRKILCQIGTRPEAIKMAPVVLALRREPWAEVRVVATAQHREMLDQVLRLFDIRPDIDLDLMRPDQSLAALTGRLAIGLDEVLQGERPDLVLAQGDTTTVMVSALTAFYRGIPFGHVEAGLRTCDRQFPFPEEMNRVFAGYLSDLHFAPTVAARDNLLREGIPEARIHITGNPVIDALRITAGRCPQLGIEPVPEGRMVLLTGHRRENFGEPFRNICRAMLALVERHPDIWVLFPVHPNPNVAEPARELLGAHPRIRLVPPLEYDGFVAAMRHAYLIVSDSGGVQEEAPALAKPVLVTREETERPEAVAAGCAKLVGPDRDRLLAEASALLSDADAYALMACGASPYGDGKAAGRIVEAIYAHFRP